VDDAVAGKVIRISGDKQDRHSRVAGLNLKGEIEA
jgi:hypothetical protein